MAPSRRSERINAPVLEIDRQIEQLLGKGDGAVLDDREDDEEGSLPIPEYIFPERARLVEAFYNRPTDSMVCLLPLWTRQRLMP
jgi:hypothetical protein